MQHDDFRAMTPPTTGIHTVKLEVPYLVPASGKYVMAPAEGGGWTMRPYDLATAVRGVAVRLEKLNESLQ